MANPTFKLDCSQGKIVFYDRDSDAAFARVPRKDRLAGVMLENPTATEDVTISVADCALVAKTVYAIILGSASPSVTFKLWCGNDRTSGTALITAGTTVTDTTSVTKVTAFDAPFVCADSMIWLTTTAKSGTVDQLFVGVQFDEADL